MNKSVLLVGMSSNARCPDRPLNTHQYRDSDEDMETITIIGKKEKTEAAKEHLQKLIKELVGVVHVGHYSCGMCGSCWSLFMWYVWFMLVIIHVVCVVHVGHYSCGMCGSCWSCDGGSGGYGQEHIQL